MPYTRRSSCFNRLSRVSVLLSICSMPMMAIAQAPTPNINPASAQVEAIHDRFHGGGDLTFKMRLNESLPEGSHFDVRLSPISVDQEITVSSGEASDKGRTEFILKTKLPEKAVPGEWHIRIVYLFLPGASWTNNTLSTNADFRFLVEGPAVEIPTKATATLVGDHP